MSMKKYLKWTAYALGVASWGFSIYCFYSNFIYSITGMIVGALMIGVGYSIGKEDQV